MVTFYEVTTVIIHGTQKARKPIPNRKFYGVIIAGEQRSVLVRMFGSTREVDGNTFQLRKWFWMH